MTAEERVTGEHGERVSADEDMCRMTTKEEDLLYMAWTVIANVSEGDWSKQPEDWQQAARKWRDDWHATLPKDDENAVTGERVSYRDKLAEVLQQALGGNDRRHRVSLTDAVLSVRDAELDRLAAERDTAVNRSAGNVDLIGRLSFDRDEQRQRAERAEAAIERAQEALTNTLGVWQPEYAHRLHRAKRGDIYNEIAVGALGDAIKVASGVLAALGQPPAEKAEEDPSPDPEARSALGDALYQAPHMVDRDSRSFGGYWGDVADELVTLLANEGWALTLTRVDR